MIKLKNLLNEELLGEHPYGYEIFRNPKSIKRMKSELRAMSYPNGDLYVVNDSSHITHTHFAEWLIKNGYKMPTNTNRFSGMMDGIKKGYIPWQRKGLTNEFWLSESIQFQFGDYPADEMMPFIVKYTNKIKRKNSQYKFILKSIWGSND